ncbi:hypothetical protein GO491_11935 [Flavobacteriaceae bacterium Ap0902]|nr:hypothetical protein [Flavobacteriaceae bacterium Ap0902]
MTAQQEQIIELTANGDWNAVYELAKAKIEKTEIITEVEFDAEEIDRQLLKNLYPPKFK